MNVGKRFRELRIKRGYPKMDQFAFEKGIGRTLVSNFENGHSDPGVKKLERMLKLLPCSLSEFFADEDRPARDYLGSKRELIMLTAEEQEWVERLLKILKSQDRAMIGMIHNALMMSEKLAPPETGREPTPKESGARGSAKKEKGRLPKARAS